MSNVNIGNVELNRPDLSIANRIKAIFEQDSNVIVEYVPGEDDVNSKVVISVNSSAKAASLRKILPETYDVSIPLDVEINDISSINGEDIVTVFGTNRHFKDYVEITNPITQQTFHVCIFKEEVIKFPNGNGGSIHGYEFRLMEDLAKEIFDVPALIFTTDDGLPINEISEKE